MTQLPIPTPSRSGSEFVADSVTWPDTSSDASSDSVWLAMFDSVSGDNMGWAQEIDAFLERLVRRA